MVFEFYDVGILLFNDIFIIMNNINILFIIILINVADISILILRS